MSAPFPGHDRAKHMGELKRGDERWDVFMEVQPDPEVGPGAVRGRLHFASGERHRTTSWIFLEWSEREMQDRFGEFSAVELWHFVEALGGWHQRVENCAVFAHFSVHCALACGSRRRAIAVMLRRRHEVVDTVQRRRYLPACLP